MKVLECSTIIWNHLCSSTKIKHEMYVSVCTKKGGKEGDKQVMKHTSNEKKHVPYLNGNPSRILAISKAAALLDFSLGIRINYDNR